MSRSARLIAAADAASRPFVALPVTLDKGEATVLSVLRDAVPGAGLPGDLSADWCVRHGLKAEPGSTVVLRSVSGPSVLLVSVGDSFNGHDSFRLAGAAAARAAGDATLAFLVPTEAIEDASAAVQALVEGALLASYDYKRPQEKGGFDVPVLGNPVPSTEVHDAAQRALNRASVIAEAVNWAKRLIDTPAGDLSPKELAKAFDARLSNDPKVKVDIWTESKVKDEKLGGLLGVGAGSDEPVRLVIARYRPQHDKPIPHIALVGKGVTFDSGGLWIKSPDGMTTMKTDMSGSAIVMAAISMAARLGLPVEITAITPLTENMLGGSATKPGDVLTIRNGTTIEVINTDAEGRLILADGLSLAVEANPDAIIDIATLTGAQRIALGDDMAAFFASTDELASAIAAASDRSGEAMWRLPLVQQYNSLIESETADVRNIGKGGGAGSIVAALILQRFTGGRPWVHIDMAGPGRADSPKGYYTRGGTAFGARTIVEFLSAISAG